MKSNKSASKISVVALSVAAWLITGSCHQRNILQKSERQWVRESREQLVLLDAYSRQLGQDTCHPTIGWLRTVPRATSEVLRGWRSTADDMSLVTMKIRLSLFDLWRITGHCLFADIPCEEVHCHISTVSARYHEFIRANVEKSTEMLLFEALEQNTNLIRTDYCEAAIMVLQDTVIFYDLAYPIAVLPCTRTTAEERDLAWAGMKRWLDANKPSLEWNAALRAFIDKEHRPNHFMLPQAVIDVFANTDVTGANSESVEGTAK